MRGCNAKSAGEKPAKSGFSHLGGWGFCNPSPKTRLYVVQYYVHKKIGIIKKNALIVKSSNIFMIYYLSRDRDLNIILILKLIRLFIVLKNNHGSSFS